MAGKPNRRGFGYTRKLPSKRWQASYIGPDAARHSATTTFDAKSDAEGWLAAEHRLIASDGWTPPKSRAERSAAPAPFAAYADAWLVHRDLKPRTRAHYRQLLDGMILDRFRGVEVGAIRPDMIRTWHSSLDPSKPVVRAHAYSLVRSILMTAVDDELLAANPCHIRGAGSARRKHQPKAATLEQLAAISDAMPARYKLMPILAAWCALRFGEITELRRGDIDVTGAVIHVRRGVVRADGKVIVGDTKSEAGARDVDIPPHLLPLIADHRTHHAAPGRDGLMFPATSGGHMSPSSLYRVYHPAREKAGRPDLRFHDLRHTGAVLAAATGATLAELMARLGHSTPSAAMRYQHAAQGRGKVIAAALSDIAARSD